MFYTSSSSLDDALMVGRQHSTVLYIKGTTPMLMASICTSLGSIKVGQRQTPNQRRCYEALYTANRKTRLRTHCIVYTCRRNLMKRYGNLPTSIGRTSPSMKVMSKDDFQTWVTKIDPSWIETLQPLASFSSLPRMPSENLVARPSSMTSTQ
jgi:hypothetical protein